MKKVSADTVTELSIAAGFPGATHGTPPAPEEMIEDIRAALALRVKSLARQFNLPKANADPAVPPSAFEISYRRAVEDVQEFEDIIANVPDGFRLRPVLYSKIRQEENDRVMGEYRGRVRRQFLVYLANNHADELSALGICQNGIERMKQGLDPTDKNDMRYDISTDHIIERGGAGKMSLEKAIDPLLPPGSAPTYIVNHFNNFILLPEQIHEFKNALNSLQKTSQTQRGQSKWILMLVPETGPGRSGFVAPPQAPGHPLYGIEKHQQTMSNRINQAALMADKAHEAIYVFQQNPATAQILKNAAELAEQQSKTIISMLEDEKKSGVLPPQGSLSTLFNNAVARHPLQKKFMEASLKPAIEEAATQLRLAFEHATRPGQTPDNYDLFVKFYRGQNITSLRRVTENLPLEEAAAMHGVFQLIDKKVKAGFSPGAFDYANDDRVFWRKVDWHPAERPVKHKQRRESRHGHPRNNRHHN